MIYIAPISLKRTIDNARLWLVASVWVMLHMRVKIHSPTPALPPGRRSQGRLTQLAPRIHKFANCHRVRPALAVRYTSRAIYIAGRLFNGLTANDRWHRIYRPQQRSLSLGRRLMLAETVAQTDGQTLPIFIYRSWRVVLLSSLLVSINQSIS